MSVGYTLLFRSRLAVRPSRLGIGLALAITGLGMGSAALPISAASGDAPVFSRAISLSGADGGTEPRLTVAPDDARYLMTNGGGSAIVYVSRDHGGSWKRTAGVPAGQTAPTIDVDIVATTTGRLVANELDGGGLNFPTSYSDDGGNTWTASTGFAKLADQDRNWLAAGPVDPTTGMSRVYLLFHNLASGAASHNMYVETSTDGGASFGPPVPTTLPGDQAWLDLQCADSGGPSSLTVNPATGRIYAVFGTRSSVAGGCGASVTGSFEINVVAATRVWVATSPDGSLGSWTQSLAVDDATAGRIVGMQLSPGALDRAGNVYVAYPESPNAYPDYTGAAIRFRWAPPDLSHWSDPVTIAAQQQPGNVLAHIVAGDPGRVAVAYFHGVSRPGTTPVWYETVGETVDGMASAPTVSNLRLSNVPTYSGTASILMGACGSGPLQGVQNGFACGRSTDVWGIAVDHRGFVTVTWPSVKETDAPGTVEATWVASQVAGASLFAGAATPPSSSAPPAGPTPRPPLSGLSNTGAAAGASAAAISTSAVLALLGLGLTGMRRRRR